MKTNKLLIVGGIVFFVLLFMLLPVNGMVQANGNGSLGISYTRTVRGDVVMAGVGLWGSGSGNIVLEDLPENAVVIDAFLYWSTIGVDNNFRTPSLEGQSVNGTRIGTSANTCWAGNNDNKVYRANVTSIVDGNDTYTISGLPDDGPTSNDTQGASLVVIYTNPGDAMRDIVIKDGAVTLDESDPEHTTTISNFTPDDPVTEAWIGYIVADGQDYWLDGDIEFNGVTLDSAVFGSTDGDYWDTVSYDVTDLSPEPGSTTSINEHNYTYDDWDCLLWLVTVFSVTTDDLEAAAVLPVVFK
jgi:hypothetical protein